jgi:2-iminobutanoate/2-iminopropanoate deaminase
MKSLAMIMLLGIMLGGCGRSDEEVRGIVREELAKGATRDYMTSAQVIGPYSPAVRVGNFLFVSGQIGLDPETGKLAGTTIESQTRQALENLRSVLQKSGYDSTSVIQCNVFLKDINDFQQMNLIYGGYFQEGRYPARTTVEVSNLPRNAIIEVAAIAYKE